MRVSASIIVGAVRFPAFFQTPFCVVDDTYDLGVLRPHHVRKELKSSYLEMGVLRVEELEVLSDVFRFQLATTVSLRFAGG